MNEKLKYELTCRLKIPMLSKEREKKTTKNHAFAKDFLYTHIKCVREARNGEERKGGIFLEFSQSLFFFVRFSFH